MPPAPDLADAVRARAVGDAAPRPAVHADQHALEQLPAHSVAHVPADRPTGLRGEPGGAEERQREPERAPDHGRSNSQRSAPPPPLDTSSARSEEHTSELQSHSEIVCRLLLEKKNMHTSHQ